MAAHLQLVAVGPASIPQIGEIGINANVLLFTSVISVLAGLVLGVLPALRSGSKDVFVALGDGGRGSTLGRARHRVRSTLVVVQVALVLVLLVGSGLTVRSFQQLLAVDPGFDAERLMTFSISPPPSRYPDGEPVARFYDELVERLEAIPGATSAAGIGGFYPLTTRIYEFPVAPEPAIMIPRVTPGYFETMGRVVSRVSVAANLPVISASIDATPSSSLETCPISSSRASTSFALWITSVASARLRDEMVAMALIRSRSSAKASRCVAQIFDASIRPRRRSSRSTCGSRSSNFAASRSLNAILSPIAALSSSRSVKT